MIKTLLLAGLATFAVGTATAQSSRAAKTPAAKTSAMKTSAMKPSATKASATASARTGKPTFGTFGYDTAGMDRTVKPGDSFFGYANGTWAKNTVIPADKPAYGGFAVLADLSEARTRTIVQDAARTKTDPGSGIGKVGTLYASFMDEAAIERAGLTPLRPYLAKIDAIRNPSDLARAFGEANRMGIDMPIGIGVQQDLKDNTQYTVYVGQGGLGLPDRDYYLVDNPKFVDARAKYRTHVANMLRLAGMSDPDGRATRVYELEKKIAQSHWTRAESRQIDKLYNPYQASQLPQQFGGFDWNAYRTAASLQTQPGVIVAQPSAIAAAAKLTGSEPLGTWKDYLTFRTLTAAAGMLPKTYADENFDFYGKTLSGVPQQRERWKRGISLVEGAMGETVGELYVQRYFTPAAKAKADELVRNIIRAMDARLAKLEWMAPETRVKARAKLAAFTPKIGYPTKWRDYSALRIVPGDAVGNALRAAEFEYQRNLDKIGKPVDRAEWGMTPQTVNAYANPLQNEIVFPAAILQPPFFDPNADDAVNYGGIGAVIGHEITHHFDDQGRKFDARGNLADWWTAEDVKRFAAMTDKVVKQYGEYEPLPGSKINGQLTLGENMADLAGLNIAYDAYKLSLGGKPAKVIDGYTGDQRFLLGYAQVWRNKYRDENLLARLTTDPHSPGHFRPNVVRNFDPWYSAFAVKPGEKLYLAPKDRIRIW